MLDGTKTKEMWHQRIMSLLKIGREKSYDYTPKETNWYQDKKLAKYEEEANEHHKTVLYMNAKDSKDFSLTKEGIGNMIANHFGKEELASFNGWVKLIEVVADKNRVIFYVGTPNHFPARPKWEGVVKHYFPNIDNFRYEQKR